MLNLLEEHFSSFLSLSFQDLSSFARNLGELSAKFGERGRFWRENCNIGQNCTMFTRRNTSLREIPRLSNILGKFNAKFDMKMGHKTEHGSNFLSCSRLADIESRISEIKIQISNFQLEEEEK